ETAERRPAERPVHDSFDGIAEWLTGPARSIESGIAVFDEFAWRMLATGLPLLRVTMHSLTLHPQFLGMTLAWWRTTGQTVQTLIAHEVADLIPIDENPVRRVVVHGETLRRRIDVAGAALDFPILHELKAAGGTDYFALPLPSAHPLHYNYMVTYVADRPGGFTEAEIAEIRRISRLLPIVADTHSQRAIARNVLNAYLGAKTGPKVLAGQIRRGTGEELRAVLWSSDLRAFTARSDRLPAARMIAILDACFDAHGKGIHYLGGDIVNFIAACVLVIFAVGRDILACASARIALNAACEARAWVGYLSAHASMAGEPSFDIVVALLAGSVTY